MRQHHHPGPDGDDNDKGNEVNNPRRRRMRSPGQVVASWFRPGRARGTTRSTLIITGGVAAFYLGASLLTMLTGDRIIASLIAGFLTIATVFLWRRFRLEPAQDPTEVSRRTAGMRTVGPVGALTLMATVAAWWLAGNIAIGWISPRLPSPGYDAVSAALRDSQLWLALLFVVIVAPIAEEALMRGFAYPLARKHLRVIPAAIITAAVFGLIHGNIMQLIIAVPLGVFCALIYEITDQLRYAAGAHILFNTMGLLAPMGLVREVSSHAVAPLAAALVGLVALMGTIYAYTLTADYRAEHGARLTSE